jgi:hypothetical protein
MRRYVAIKSDAPRRGARRKHLVSRANNCNNNCNNFVNHINTQIRQNVTIKSGLVLILTRSTAAFMPAAMRRTASILSKICECCVCFSAFAVGQLFSGSDYFRISQISRLYLSFPSPHNKISLYLTREIREPNLLQLRHCFWFFRIRGLRNFKLI